MTTRTRRHGLLRRLWDELLFSLCRLNRIQFDAPWRAQRPTC